MVRVVTHSAYVVTYIMMPYSTKSCRKSTQKISLFPLFRVVYFPHNFFWTRKNETMDYSPWPTKNRKILTSGGKDAIGKSISIGAEWHKFQLSSTFQRGIKRPQRMTSIWSKRLIIVHGFRPKSENFYLAKKDTIGKSISRGAEWHKFQLRSTFQ